MNDILYLVTYGMHSPYEGGSSECVGIFSSKKCAEKFVKEKVLPKLEEGRIKYKLYGDEWCDRDPNQGYSFDYVSIEEAELDPKEFDGQISI